MIFHTPFACVTTLYLGKYKTTSTMALQILYMAISGLKHVSTCIHICLTAFFTLIAARDVKQR